MYVHKCMHAYFSHNSAEEFDNAPSLSNPSSTPTHFTSVNCTGLEFNIGQCQFSTDTRSCTTVVGVSCVGAPGL